jgi:hypothetical protein
MTCFVLKKLFFSNSLLCKACLRCLWGREGRKGSERGVSQQLCEAHVALGWALLVERYSMSCVD